MLDKRYQQCCNLLQHLLQFFKHCCNSLQHLLQLFTTLSQSFTTFVAILYNICCNPCVTLFFKLGKKNYNNVAKNYNNVAKNYNNVVNNYNIFCKELQQCFEELQH